MKHRKIAQLISLLRQDLRRLDNKDVQADGTRLFTHDNVDSRICNFIDGLARHLGEKESFVIACQPGDTDLLGGA